MDTIVRILTYDNNEEPVSEFFVESEDTDTIISILEAYTNRDDVLLCRADRPRTAPPQEPQP